MAPKFTKAWMLTIGAALLVLSAALNLDLCARPERSEIEAEPFKDVRRELSGGPGALPPAPVEKAAERAPETGAAVGRADAGTPPAYAREDVLAAALATDFPELSLSGDELAQLSAALAELEQAVRGIRGLEQNAADAKTLKQLQARRDQALGDFERIAGMSLAEFLRRAPAEGGIDTGDDDDEEIILEPLAPSQPQPVR